MFEAKYKALSLTEPMAWAIFHGKDIENRQWNTFFRGRFYIHASKKFDKGHYDWIAQNENRLGLQLPQKEDFTYGAIIGEATLVSVVTVHTSRWFMGRYGFVLRDAVEYDEPVPCKGSLGFFKPVLTDVEVFKF